MKPTDDSQCQIRLISLLQLHWQNSQWFHLSNFFRYSLSKRTKRKTDNTIFSPSTQNFIFQTCLFHFSFTHFQHLDECRSWFLLFVSSNSDCNWVWLVRLSIKQTSVCIFLRLCEGQITIPTDSHQLQSYRLRLKFLMNTTFPRWTTNRTKQQMHEEKNANHRHLLVAHIYRETESDTYVGVWNNNITKYCKLRCQKYTPNRLSACECVCVSGNCQSICIPECVQCCHLRHAVSLTFHHMMTCEYQSMQNIPAQSAAATISWIEWK